MFNHPLIIEPKAAFSTKCIKRKNIQKKSFLRIKLRLTWLYYPTKPVLYLARVYIKTQVGFLISQLHNNGIWQLSFSNLHKSLIVLPWHTNIYIIVPRDKAPMPDGTQKCTRTQPIPQAVTFTNSISNPKETQHYQLRLAQRSGSQSTIILNQLLQIRHPSPPFLTIHISLYQASD